MNNSSNSTTSQVDFLLTNLSIANQVFAFYCVAVHLVYFVLMMFLKELRTKSFFFINHSVVTNAISPLALLAFEYFDPSEIENQTTVGIICSIFEIYWSFAFYIEMYSILLIAVHRYLAVFKIEFFKKINASNVYLIVSVVSIWFVSLALSFIFKYAFGTSYSVKYCFNGFSSSFVDSLLYALAFILFAMIVPAIAVVVLYIMIYMRLQSSGKRVHSQSTDSMQHKHKAREMRFANQFIVMCTVVVLILCGFIIIGLKGVIPNYFNLFYYWRPVLRIYILFFASIIPILVLYFNPFTRRYLKLFNLIRLKPENNSHSSQK